MSDLLQLLLEFHREKLAILIGHEAGARSIVQYDANGTREDLDLITDGLEERQVLPRLHSAIPAGPARAL